MTDNVTALLLAAGIPVTRANWIGVAWGDPIPDPWCMEDECQLPAELQDLSQVQTDD